MKSNIDDSHWMDNFTAILEEDIIGVKLGLYGVGLLGLGLAMRRVRPFKKIVSPNDIPQSFIARKVMLKGKIVGIEFFPKVLLSVDHEPLLGASLRRTGYLPVNLEGVNVTGNGISWLQNIVVGKNVDFLVVDKQKEFLSCLVYENKRDIGHKLVAIGFASVAPFNNNLENDEDYKKYYKTLLQTENIAERKGNGMWWDRPRRFSLLDFILSKMPLLKLKTVFQRT